MMDPIDLLRSHLKSAEEDLVLINSQIDEEREKIKQSTAKLDELVKQHRATEHTRVAFRSVLDQIEYPIDSSRRYRL